MLAQLQIYSQIFSKTNSYQMQFMTEMEFQDIRIRQVSAPLRLRGPNNVGELLNVKLIITDISVTVAQIKKIQKTRCIFFRILLLGGPSPPIQLVPNPFNWSPNTVFTDIYKVYCSKCNYPKCIFVKCTRLACLLSFANLFT